LTILRLNFKNLHLNYILKIDKQLLYVYSDIAQLVNSNGIRAQNFTQSNEYIDLSNLKEGIYYIQLRNDSKMFIGKFIKI